MRRISVSLAGLTLPGLMLLAAATPAAAAVCKAAGAVYRPASPDLTGAESAQYEAVLRARRGVMANEAQFMLVMRQTHTGGEHRFGFAQPNGYGQTLIFRLDDKAGAGRARADDARTDDTTAADEAQQIESSALFFDARLRVIDPLMSREAATAPAYMLFADLGKAHWYSTLPDARSFVPPRTLWKRVACGT